MWCSTELSFLRMPLQLIFLVILLVVITIVRRIIRMLKYGGHGSLSAALSLCKECWEHTPSRRSGLCHKLVNYTRLQWSGPSCTRITICVFALWLSAHSIGVTVFIITLLSNARGSDEWSNVYNSIAVTIAILTIRLGSFKYWPLVC